MIEYVKVISEIGKLQRKMFSDFLSFVKQKEINSLNPQEILILVEVYNFLGENEEISITELANKGTYVIQHLLFHLNRIEKRNLISLKAGKNSKSLFVSFTHEGRSLLEELSLVSITKKKELSALQMQIAKLSELKLT